MPQDIIWNISQVHDAQLGAINQSPHTQRKYNWVYIYIHTNTWNTYINCIYAMAYIPDTRPSSKFSFGLIVNMNKYIRDPFHAAHLPPIAIRGELPSNRTKKNRTSTATKSLHKARQLCCRDLLKKNRSNWLIRKWNYPGFRLTTLRKMGPSNDIIRMCRKVFHSLIAFKGSISGTIGFPTRKPQRNIMSYHACRLVAGLNYWIVTEQLNRVRSMDIQR